MTGNSDIEALLPRYFSGEATDEERMRVVQWVRESDEHARIARQIQQLCLAADALDVLERVDTERALKQVNARIDRARFRRLVRWTERVAAVLFLPLLALSLFLINNPEKPRMLEVRTNPGMTTRLTLPDGTQVCLNSESALIYPEKFEGKTRAVKLAGEAFFEVAKDARRRFVVETPHQAQVEVHGTKFNLEAFALDSVVVNTLLEGRVDFVSAWGNMPMKPGEKLVYHTHGNWMDKFLTDGEVESAWKDGRIVFHNTPFDEALRMLEKRYYVDFVVTNPEYEADSFTGTFTNQRLDRILEIFEISSGVRWRYVPRADKNEIKRKIEIY